MTATARPRPAPSAFALRMNRFKLTFHKISRAAHAYLSAFAFIALIFFSLTGLILNHPGWFENTGAEERTEIVNLPVPAMEQAVAGHEPDEALDTLLRANGDIVGTMTSSEIFEDEAYFRFAGPKGRSDVILDIASGEAEISTRRAGFVDFMGDLHRGKDAGAVWKLVIDISAILILALSLLGFFLFFLIRFRRRTSLILMAASALIIAGVPVLLVS